MSSFPGWFIDVYEHLETVVRKTCHDDAVADRVEDALKLTLIDKVADGELPEVRSSGLAFLRRIVHDALVDDLRHRHLLMASLTEEALDAATAREPGEDGPRRDWEACEADLFPWARERLAALGAELTAGMIRMLELADGITDEEAAARLALPVKQLRRDKCRLLLRLAQVRRRLEGDKPGAQPPAAPARTTRRRRGPKRGGSAGPSA